MIQVHPATLRGLRTRYQRLWNLPWPHDNEFLAELWLEARAATRATTARVPPESTYTFALETMRENHEFTPAPNPEGEPQCPASATHS